MKVLLKKHISRKNQKLLNEGFIGGERIERDKNYPVQAIRIEKRSFSYYILDETQDAQSGYPLIYPAEMFEINDESMPSNWVCSRVYRQDWPILITFREWAIDSDYAIKLIDANFDSVIRQTFIKNHQL